MAGSCGPVLSGLFNVEATSRPPYFEIRQIVDGNSRIPVRKLGLRELNLVFVGFQFLLLFEIDSKKDEERTSLVV